MARRVLAQVSAVACALALTAATGIAGGAESTEESSIDVGAAARRLSAELLDTEFSKHRPPLTADAEHARTIDPVLTEAAAIWIHEGLPAPPLTVMGGRVFTYRDVPYDPLEAPLLKIRPTDDGQLVPFLARMILWPTGPVPSHAALSLRFPAPLIFDTGVSRVKAWIGHRRVEFSIERSVSAATLTIRLPLATAGGDRPDGSETPITIIVEGEILLAAYAPLTPRRFAPIDTFPYDPAVGHLSKLQIGLDAEDEHELQRILEIAGSLARDGVTEYERVVTVNSWVGGSLQYRQSAATRSPLEALEDRNGDCDDHSGLMVAMLRGMGIVARRSTGLLYNLDTLSPHVWVEVGLPTRDGNVHWFIVDPTLAGASRSETGRSSFVQFKNRILLYPFRPSFDVEGIGGRRTSDVLFNWRRAGETSLTDGARLAEFIDEVVEEVDRRISGMAEGLSERNLLLQRQSSSIAGSPYIVFDRPVGEDRDSRLRLLLENEERLRLELTAPPTEALDSKSDLKTIEHLSRAYRDLNGIFFSGAPAHRNLELVYDRNRHTDQLHTVSLRVGRYLVENQLGRVLKRLSILGLLTEAEVARLNEIAEASGGKNLYVSQELAGQLPSE